MKTNRPREKERTHGGAVAAHINPEQRLRRSVMACLLWEKEFYEDGESIAKRIAELVPQVDPAAVAAIAIEARNKMKLRHVPLFIVREMARHKEHKKHVRAVLANVIQRADEITELLALYWTSNNGKHTLPAQVKKGIADAFPKFDAYQLGKYDRDGVVKLRDALRMCRPKPKDQAMAEMWAHLLNRTLPAPDTWEVSLSAGKDKRETWERLLSEEKLGYLALLRNLRNMVEADVDRKLIAGALAARKGAHNVLPFRFVAAAMACPKLEPEIDTAFLAHLGQKPKLPGKTVAIIDVSGSMYGGLVSGKSDMSRAHAACALAAILREVCEEPVIYATAGSDWVRTHKTEIVPARRGMALVDAIFKMCKPLGGGGIFLKQVMDYVIEKEKGVADRVVVITDEQDCDHSAEGAPAKAKMFEGARHYLINVASARNGIGYGKWTHFDGWSEAILDYISEYEKEQHVAGSTSG